jgi:hypothetical protein
MFFLLGPKIEEISNQYKNVNFFQSEKKKFEWLYFIIDYHCNLAFFLLSSRGNFTNFFDLQDLKPGSKYLVCKNLVFITFAAY